MPALVKVGENHRRDLSGAAAVGAFERYFRGEEP